MNFEHQMLIQITRIADSLEKLAACTEIFDEEKPEDGRVFFVGQPAGHITEVDIRGALDEPHVDGT